METTASRSTREIANHLVEWCNKGDYMKAYHELYSPGIVSIETEDEGEMARMEGMDAVMKKAQWWADTFDAHHIHASEPIISENWFSVKFEMDTTHKPSGQRSKSSEIAVFKTKDGKIVREQFFYDKP